MYNITPPDASTKMNPAIVLNRLSFICFNLLGSSPDLTYENALIRIKTIK